jgi:hypothetical protein
MKILTQKTKMAFVVNEGKGASKDQWKGPH